MPALPPAARRRRRRRLIGAATVPAAGWLLSLGSVVSCGMTDQAGPADAIVVLGAAQYAGRPSPVLRARLDHAIDLYRGGFAPRVILTGGTGTGDTTSEAAVGRRYALQRGVPDTALLLEQRGRSTSESIRAVADVLAATGRTRVLLVSDRFHMMRLWILARRAGLAPRTSPTRTSPIDRRPAEAMSFALSESVKVPVALVLGLHSP